MPRETDEKAKPNLNEFADLGDEISKYVGTLSLERETKKEISRFVNDVQGVLSRPVKLSAGQLNKWFPSADSAVLVDGEKLIVRQGKKETAVSLLELEPDPYFAVVKEVATEVTRLMEQADAKRAQSIKPSLQVFARLIGGKLAVFDWRNYELVLANVGGNARNVTISVSPTGKEKYGPFDINSMETTEFRLRHLYQILNSRTLKITARCEDDDGRRYTGEAELEVGSKAVRLFHLATGDVVSR